jgi:transcriptional regulator with XRE-family HTH domain
MKGFGKKLQELRAGKSRKEVADAVGISVSALAMYELEERIPRDEYKIKLADYYRVSIEWLFFSSAMSQNVATSNV